jgi:hypothetical protein
MLKAISMGSVLFLACLAVTGLALAQDNGGMRLPASIRQGPGADRVPVRSGDGVQEQQARSANLQRLVEIKRDTEKMAQLSAELREYVEKTDQTVMSVDAIKKAELLEKLAHSVKTKMKQSF